MFLWNFDHQGFRAMLDGYALVALTDQLTFIPPVCNEDDSAEAKGQSGMQTSWGP